ncbi:pitrilysin family protein [Pollutibacter soli]|uniref:M16 family metallopeptidase n=1 Tax=Pollutibacter soli TaxID=3034157 RepID=UPI0030134F80
MQKTALNRKKEPAIVEAVKMDLHLKPYDHFVLDNHIPVYAIEAGTQDVMQVELVFFAGNSYEDQNLVASATNAMLKNGTSKKSAFEISEYVDFYGAYLSTNCYNETATVTLHCLTRYLPDLLPLINEMVSDPVFPEQELEIYKMNMKQRLEVNLKKCDVVAERLIDEHLYGAEHPYGKNSSIEAYNALQVDQLKTFFERYYRNGTCIAFCAGHLPADIAPLLNKYIGTLPVSEQKPKEKSLIYRPSAEKKFRVMNDPSGVQGAIRIGRPFPSRHHPDYQKVQVLNTLFGGFFGSRLMSNIREDKGYTYGIFSFIQNHINDTALVISTEAGRDVCEAAIKEVYLEMKRLRDESVPAEELDLVRNYLMGTILGDLDGPFHIISRWKNIILSGLDDKYFYRFIDIIRNVTPAELQELANKYYRDDDFYELVVI